MLSSTLFYQEKKKRTRENDDDPSLDSLQSQKIDHRIQSHSETDIETFPAEINAQNLSEGRLLPKDHIQKAIKCVTRLKTKNFCIELDNDLIFGIKNMPDTFIFLALKNNQVIMLQNNVKNNTMKNNPDVKFHSDLAQNIETGEWLTVAMYPTESESAIHQIELEKEIMEKMGVLVDYTASNGTIYTTRKYIAGLDLSVLLEKQTLTFKSKLKITMNINHAINILHRAGYTHCDLKPENIISNELFDISLIDFDVSLRLDENKKALTNKHRGSYGFLAPELLETPSGSIIEYSEKTDIYSFGVVLTKLFNLDEYIDLLPSRLLKSQAKSIETLLDEEKKILSLISNMICEDPNKRLTTVEIDVELNKIADIINANDQKPSDVIDIAPFNYI